MATIQPPKVLNSFREQPIDPTGLQSPKARPRTNQNLQEEVQASIAKPKPPSADEVMLSAKAKQVTAKPSAMKLEAPPAEKPAPAPVQASATEAAKGKAINILA